jgi:xanthine dehydrogenase YagS FAD-binding subunit
MGTIGGNICQDVWCWYLQDGFSCWKSGGSFCDLAGGDSSIYGSVMGGHLCLSNHPSDTAPALAALDAEVSMVSPRGGRKLPMGDFLPGHVWIGGRLQCHVLEPDEIVTEIGIPAALSRRSAYLKFAHRKSWDFSLASAAVSAVVEEGVCRDVRIVLGGVATQPYRSPEAENALDGKRIDEESARQAGEVALQRARPLKMNKYKIDLAKVLVRRAFMAIAQG